jgi:hypothetical protein
MRKILFIFLLSFPLLVSAQAIRIATFDTLNLSQADTFYLNYSAPGTDVGFNDQWIHFPCVYDTAFGSGYWSYGFAYSNMTDTVTSGFGNQYSAKTGKGYNNSSNYAVAYGTSNVIGFSNPGFKKFTGFYVTNNTYAFNSMRDGDPFAKKFGGLAGNDPDWFKLVVRPYQNGQAGTDSVQFYLADYRTANDYIVNNWQWVDLSSLPIADSLQFDLSSSDNGAWGMNTPAYFCMDNLTYQLQLGISSNNAENSQIKVYPIPAKNSVTVELNNNDVKSISIMDMAGKLIKRIEVGGSRMEIQTNDLVPGMYMMLFGDGKNSSSIRIVKQ